MDTKELAVNLDNGQVTEGRNLTQEMLQVAHKNIGMGDWLMTMDGESLVIYRPNATSSKRIIIYKDGKKLEFNEEGKKAMVCNISPEQRDSLLAYRSMIDLDTF